MHPRRPSVEATASPLSFLFVDRHPAHDRVGDQAQPCDDALLAADTEHPLCGEVEARSAFRRADEVPAVLAAM
jgi:hypothetical protein